MPSTAGGSVLEEPTKRTRGLARKLTCSVVSIGALLWVYTKVMLGMFIWFYLMWKRRNPWAAGGLLASVLETFCHYCMNRHTHEVSL